MMKGDTIIQMDLFEPLPMAHHTPADWGCVWWAGNWECRNWLGWMQSREGGRGEWQFQVAWFSNDDRHCSVYRIAADGQTVLQNDVSISRTGVITIDGRKFGRKYWNH